MTTSCRLLLIEESHSTARAIEEILRRKVASFHHVLTGGEAMRVLAERHFDVVVLDLNVKDMDPMELMRALCSSSARRVVIAISDQGSVSNAVEAMREGAYDFLLKPVSATKLLGSLERAYGKSILSPRRGVTQASPQSAGWQLTSHSPAMKTVQKMILTAAKSSATVFITGESGTGKEVTAQAIHKYSPRSTGPFVPLNCAALPKDLLESELFGHVKGAFTGAVSDRLGAALRANGGTLFLDEICEMDISLQAKLLRLLQTREVQRLGEDKIHQSDVRFVCATNRDPMKEVLAGRFREDLYYRLFVIPVRIPPLRDRPEDIVPLAEHFLASFAADDNALCPSFGQDAIVALRHHPWPGNVRELENVVRRAYVFRTGSVVTADMLGLLPSPVAAQPVTVSVTSLEQPGQIRLPMGTDQGEFHQKLDDIVRIAIEYAIKRANGSVPKAAASLGVSPSTLYRRMEVWKSDDRDFA